MSSINVTIVLILVRLVVVLTKTNNNKTGSEDLNKFTLNNSLFERLN